MAKKQSNILGLIAWFTGVVVSLVVGNGMINETLGLPSWLGGTSAIGAGIAVFIGWVVIVTTLVGAVMAILKK